MNRTIVCPVITHTVSTGFLWWKKSNVIEYYFYNGFWYISETDEKPSAEMQAKLTRAHDKIRGYR